VTVVSTLPYTIRRSRRATRARINVAPEGVEVVLPEGVALAEVEPFFEQKRPWIERTLRRMREAEADRPPVLLEDGGEVPYLGSRLELAVSVEPGRTRPHVSRRGHSLLVKVGDEAGVQEALERWYRRRARTEIEPRLDAAVARARTHYSKLSIRSQRTRWASCSSSGAMSFNWRLLLAPEEILDYVVEHEVAHLEVHDHSQRFWNLLESRVPEVAERERWLRRNGQTLRFP
jgi:predicted metal-dependent hydrolase